MLVAIQLVPEPGQVGLATMNMTLPFLASSSACGSEAIFTTGPTVPSPGEKVYQHAGTSPHSSVENEVLW